MHVLDMKRTYRAALGVVIQARCLQNHVGHAHCQAVHARKEIVELENMLYNVPGVDKVNGIQALLKCSLTKELLPDLETTPPCDCGIFAVRLERVCV